MTKTSPEPDFASFAEVPSETVPADTREAAGAPPHLLDGERVATYLTLAGLLEAGIDTERAVSLLQTETRARKSGHNADRLAEFFRTVSAARGAMKDDHGPYTDTIGEAAERCFGKDFLSVEETVLLRGLAYSDNIPVLLRAAAELVRTKASQVPQPRPFTPPGRRQRS